MWYCKMYYSGDKEVFEYDAYGMQGYPADKQEFPFLESLLTFLEMDLSEAQAMLRVIVENWERYFATGDRDCFTQAMQMLGELSVRHVYFMLLYKSWFDWTSRQDNAEEGSRMLSDLRHLPEQLPQLQEQILLFFARVLDVDTAGRDPQKQAAENYLHDAPRDAAMFRFRPIPLSFEPTEPGRCCPVLYSGSIPDMIDYSLRSCVEREITVRRCKSCGRYFPQTVRVSAEYCSRPTKDGAPSCREIGSFQLWEKKQREDPIFKVYRREYKRRFAWIKAGRITADDFYVWSDEAREKRDACANGELSQAEYETWLKLS